ncbi:response regulator [Pseudidiomarina sp.]|uniref:response regulator n=1 Tax=Pseudidiomarina sp. TaxID=2081707 RepID=UPI00299D83DC|nr:response regulator [Pseudidiomarina sp.]MDX1706118.1 response regulator [Pseudidiomarina sp.]
MSDKGPKILVVDDDFVSLEVIKSMLSHYPSQVITAECGAEAVEKALAERPQLLLLDYELPDFNGIEVYCRIHDELGEGTPPAGLITGHDDEEIKERCTAAGIEQQLSKPLSVTDLTNLMRIAGKAE